MNLNDGDKIASLAKIAREDVEAQLAAEEAPPGPEAPPQATEPESDLNPPGEPPAE
jgi:hypothetical protein